MKQMLFSFLFLLITTNFAQVQRILLDENYDDWNDKEIAYSDQLNDNSSGAIDFGNLWIHNDDQFLFIRLEVGDEINLQDYNEVTMYIDTDNNTSTGASINGIGAELSYTFGERSGSVQLNGSNSSIRHDDIGLITSPTVTSTQFEIAVNRAASINGNMLFAGNEIKLVFANSVSGGDVLPDESNGVSYSFVQEELTNLPQFSIEKNSEADIRVMAYNVERDGFFDSEKQPHFQRIFQAVKPDIIGFSEIYDHTSGQTKDVVNSYLPDNWYHSKSPDVSGNSSDIICVSKYEIKETYRIPGYYSGNPGNGAFLIDLQDEFNTDLLFIVAHPPCCDNNQDRQDEVDAIMAFVRDAKDEGGELTIDPNTPIMIVGDMNLVGFKEQLNTFLTGDISDEATFGNDFEPDWDGTNLEDAIPTTTNTPFFVTWYNLGSSFAPGRLDFIFYTGSVLEKLNGFTLFTDALPQDSLDSYQLNSEDATSASDHLPVIADFKFDLPTSIKTGSNEIPSQYGLDQNYPNPFNPSTVIKFDVPDIKGKNEIHTTINIYDLLGNKVKTILDEYITPGIHEINFNADGLTSGVYLYRMISADFTDTKKMLLIR